MASLNDRLKGLEDTRALQQRRWGQEEPRNEGAEKLFAYEREQYLAGSSGLVYDADEDAFYTSSGELAVSRTYANLERIFNSL